MPIKRCPKCGEEYDTMYFHSCEKKLPKKSNEKLGFGWGNFYIAGHVLGAIFLAISLITAVYNKEYPYSGLPLVVDILKIILVILWNVVSAWLLIERKKWGLYLVYINLILTALGAIRNSANSLMKIINKGVLTGSELDSIIFMPAYLLTSYLLFRYFRKRRSWFK